MKKRNKRFERELGEVYNNRQVLQKEGKTDGECRAYVQIATVLLLIDDSLFMICRALYILLGFVISQFLSGLF